MKLYFTPGTISIAVAIALEEAGLDYEPIRIDFATAEQTKPDYLELNPKGRVPTLVTDGGTILTETGALLEYVADLAPEGGLVPNGAEDAAHMRSVMYYIASTMHVNHAHKMRGTRWAKQQNSFDDMTAMVPETMRASAMFVEAEALRGNYVCGEHFSIADPFLYIPCRWLEGDDVNVTAFPKITAFLDRMTNRPSVRAVMQKGML